MPGGYREHPDVAAGSGAGDPELIAFRYCDYDVPFWVRANSREGRWHVVGDPPTQYWSTTPDGAWAELIRAEELTLEDELDLLRMPIWVCRIPCLGLIDLRDSASQEQHGITAADLTSEDWSACQRVATHVRASARGVISPSAAMDDASNVTLFGPRRAIALEQRPALASAVPSAVVAHGRPRPGLIPSVLRRTGYPHPTLF